MISYFNNRLNQLFNQIEISGYDGFYITNKSKGCTSYIYFEDQDFYILIFKNKKLLYYNFFLIEKNKFLNYIFLILNELEIDQNNLSLVISGKDKKDYKNRLKEYFKNISIYQSNELIEKTKESNNISLLFNHYL